MSKETESSLKGWQKAIQTMSNYRPKKLYVTASYEDFKEGQWWLLELDAMVANGTPHQKRAVAVVRNLMNQFNQKTIDQEHADSMYQGLLKESQASIDMLTAKVKELEKDNFALAATQCAVKGGLINDEYGHQYCKFEKHTEAQPTEQEPICKIKISDTDGYSFEVFKNAPHGEYLLYTKLAAQPEQEPVIYVDKNGKLKSKVSIEQVETVLRNALCEIQSRQEHYGHHNYQTNAKPPCKDCGGSGYAPPSTDRFLCPACSGKQPL